MTQIQPVLAQTADEHHAGALRHVGVVGHVEVDVPSRSVGGAIVLQSLDNLQHLGDVSCGPGEMVGQEDIQLGFVLVKGFGGAVSKPAADLVAKDPTIPVP